MKVHTKSDYRKRRHLRLRKKVKGTAERPRMSVFLSNQHIHVQFIDDDAARTLVTATTEKKGRASGVVNNAAHAVELGKEAAKRAREKGIEEVVFDRGGFRYSGRLKVLADAAREAGLKF